MAEPKIELDPVTLENGLDSVKTTSDSRAVGEEEMLYYNDNKIGTLSAVRTKSDSLNVVGANGIVLGPIENLKNELKVAKIKVEGGRKRKHRKSKRRINRKKRRTRRNSKK
jgi:hypothetical protein